MKRAIHCAKWALIGAIFHSTAVSWAQQPVSPPMTPQTTLSRAIPTAGQSTLEASSQPNRGRQPTSDTASLLLIKSDWSKSAASPEIEVELQSALKAASIPQELLEKLPASGAQALFPSDVAVIYSAQHYAELLAWLKSQGLVQESIPFQSAVKIAVSPRGAPYEYAAALNKSCDFLGLPSMSLGADQPFVKREPGFLWTIEAHPDYYTLAINRRLVVSEWARGQTEPQIKDIHDNWSFRLDWVYDGQVAIINSFPEQITHAAALRKGFEALIVVERSGGDQPANVVPRLNLPDKVETIPIRPRLQYKFAEEVDEEKVATMSPARPKGGRAEEGTKSNETQLKVFTLRNAKATDAERIVTQLFGRSIHSAAADERTNSLIVRGSDDELNIIYHILTRLDDLDQPSNRDNQWPTTKTPARDEWATSESVLQLNEKYAQKEQQAGEIAGQIRELKSSGKENHVQLEKRTAELRKLVGEAFAARQKLHQAEAAQLQQRIVGIQKNLQTRERLSEEIIERRVKELLDPALKWERDETTQRPAARTQGSASPGQIAAAQMVRDKLRDRWNQVYSLYEHGRIRLTEVLQAAKELNDSEIAAAMSEKENWDARKAGLDRLKQVQSIVNAKFAAEVEPEFQKLSVDAEVLKAEGQLAQDGASRSPNWASAASSQNSPTERAEELTKTEAQRIWNVLGVKVRPWIPKDEDPLSPRSWHTGGAEITEVRLDGPVDGPNPLRNGDIIIQLGRWEVFSPQRLAVILSQPRNHGEMMEVEGRVMQRVEIQVLRGNTKVSNTFGIPFEFPFDTTEKTANAPLLFPDAEAQKIWDVLGIKVRAASTQDLSDERYAGGAVITAVRPGSPADGMAPLRVNDIIVRLGGWEVTSPRRLAFILTQPFANWMNSNNLLGVIEVLRGKGDRREMAQISIEFLPESIIKPPPRPQETPTAQPASAAASAADKVVAGLGGQATTLRSPDEFRKNLVAVEAAVARFKSQDLTRYAGKDEAERLQTRQHFLENAERNLAFAREEYGAQIRMLELEVQDATSAFQSATKQHNLSHKKLTSGEISHEAVLTLERAVEEARLRLERANRLLDIYRKADPRNAAPADPKGTAPETARPT